MKKWNDFFDEAPSQQQDQRVLLAVQPALAKNSSKQENLLSKLFTNWSVLSAGLTAASALGISIYLASKSDLSPRTEDFGFMAFQDLLPLNIENDEQLLVDETLDLDLLDNLDLLEKMEDA